MKCGNAHLGYGAAARIKSVGEIAGAGQRARRKGDTVFELTEEDQAIARVTRSFIEREVMPFEPILIQREAEGGSGELTREEELAIQKKGQASGLWGIDLPEEDGGADLSMTAQCIVHFEMGRTFIRFEFGGVARPSLHLLEGDLRKRYLDPVVAGEKVCSFALSEPGVGSDAGNNLRTTAVLDGDSWILNGEKTWISRGNDADFAIVFARTPMPNDPHGVTAFLVDRDMGFTSKRIEMMCNEHGTSSLFFDDVRVPKDNHIGEVGQAFSSVAAMSLRRRRIWGIALNAGAMDRLLEMAIEWSENRVTFGKPLSERENIQWMIADGETATRATKLLCLHAASLYDRGLDHRHATDAAKVFGANAAMRVADDVMQIHGAMGIAKETGIERYYRKLRMYRFADGSDEMQRRTIARDLFKRNTKVGEIL